MLKTNIAALYRITINDVALDWGHIRKSQGIAFAVVVRLGSANCLGPVTSPYLRRLDDTKLI